MSSARENVGASDYDLIVAGGGAAGFFAAIACAEACDGARVLILEKSREVLGKVKVSGGGRCNVTHACFDPKELSGFYPRGARQLIGPLHRWGPADTVEWFESRGVPLKTEADRRVFPQSDQSQSIIDCLTRAARDAGVELRKSTAVKDVVGADGGGFEVSLDNGEVLRSKCLLMTLGGTRNRIGADLAERFGHRIETAAPSLFTFKIVDTRIADLQGLAVADAVVRVDGMKLEARGPVLVTHWGLSGPGILKLSAWGARELQVREYRFETLINWCGGIGEQEVITRFDALRGEAPRRRLAGDPQFGVPVRMWRRLVEAAAREAGSAVDVEELRWPHLTRDLARSLARQLIACRFKVEGKSMNKDEFVTCGGVHLGDVNFKTMESRKAPGLYFAGEILDIDGVTGGFNFQAAWTTGKIAGEAVAGVLA